MPRAGKTADKTKNALAESNLQPSDSKSVTLSIELRAPLKKLYRNLGSRPSIRPLLRRGTYNATVTRRRMSRSRRYNENVANHLEIMLGPIFIFSTTAYVALMAFLRPHIGAIGCFGFAILCPKLNLPWSLPVYDYQKFIAIPTIIGFLIAVRRNRLCNSVKFAIAGISFFLLTCILSSTQSIRPDRSWYYTDNVEDNSGRVIGILVLRTPRQIWIYCLVVTIGRGWNAFNVNQLYLENGFIVVDDFMWNYLDNNTYSISTVPMMAFSASLAVCATKLWQRGLAGFIFAMQMHQLMILQSRGTMIGGLLLGTLAVIFMPKTYKAISFVVGATIVGALMAGPSVLKEFNSSCGDQGQLDASAESRYYLV